MSLEIHARNPTAFDGSNAKFVDAVDALISRRLAMPVSCLTVEGRAVLGAMRAGSVLATACFFKNFLRMHDTTDPEVVSALACINSSLFVALNRFYFASEEDVARANVANVNTIVLHLRQLTIENRTLYNNGAYTLGFESPSRNPICNIKWLTRGLLGQKQILFMFDPAAVLFDVFEHAFYPHKYSSQSCVLCWCHDFDSNTRIRVLEALPSDFFDEKYDRNNRRFECLIAVVHKVISKPIEPKNYDLRFKCHELTAKWPAWTFDNHQREHAGQIMRISNEQTVLFRANCQRVLAPLLPTFPIAIIQVLATFLWS